MQSFLARPGVRNLVALVCIQGSNALVPLLIVPFALWMVGTTAYAQVAITEAISAFALAVVLFSFDVDGVVRAARLGKPADRAAIGTILSAVLSARLLLFVTVSPLLLSSYWLAGGESVFLLALWLLVPLGQVFHSYWFYQAIENNMPAAAITLASRVATVAVMALSVRDSGDAALIPLAVGGPFFLGGLASTLYIVRSLGVPIRWVGLDVIRADLRHGKEVFAGNAAVTLYREMNVVVLGIVGVPAAGISTYALVEKSIKMLQACTRPLSQLFFPKVLFALKRHSAPNFAVARLISRYTLPQIGAAAALILIIPLAYSIGAAWIPVLRDLGELQNAKIMAGIMAPATLLGLANFMYGTAGLNALGERNYYFLSIVLTGVLSILVCFFLGQTIGAIGASIAFLLAETILFMLVIVRYLGTRPPADPGAARGLAP